MMYREIRKINRSPESVLEDLMNEYMGFVYSIVYRKLNTVATKEDIEETVSDVFVNVYKSIDKFDPKKSSIKTFVAVISKNIATDRYRQLTKNVCSVSIDELVEVVSDEEANVDSCYIIKEEQEAIFNAVLSLKEPNRTIIFRRFYLNESIIEISKKVGYSPNAVQKRLKTSLKKLKTKLEDFCFGK